MSTLQYKSGLGNSAAYQVAGTPQVDSGSGAGTTVINYDYVTSEVMLMNVTSGSRITAFFDGAADGIQLPAACCQVVLNIKCRLYNVICN